MPPGGVYIYSRIDLLEAAIADRHLLSIGG